MFDTVRSESLADFQSHPGPALSRVKATKRPLVLTVNGEPQIVVQDAGSYSDLLDKVDEMETLAGIREAEAEFDRGEGRPAYEALLDLKERLGIPG